MTTLSTQVSGIYGANAAPVATSPTTLGALTSQPATTATATTGGNAAIATGYNPTPVVGGGAATTGGAAPNVAALANQLAPAGTNQQAVTAAANIATQQLQTSYDSASSGGGAIGDALKSGTSKIVAFAQKGMADIQKAIQGDMAANNGEVDPAKMQLYTMKMSTYELLNQMAAKIQEKEERSIQVWLQR
jgi:hypothetical protein